MANTKKTQKIQKTQRRRDVEADAKAKVAKLNEMKATHERNEKLRSIALVISLFLNLTFVVTVYVILEQNK